MSFLRKIVTKTLLLISVLAFVFTSHTIHAEDTQSKSSLPVGTLYNWFLDEAHGYIYLIGEKKITILGKSDLHIKKVILLDSDITNLAFYGDRLYLAANGKIIVIDITGLKQESSIPVKGTPKDLAVEKDKIFYVLDNTMSVIYEYNTVSKKNKEVVIPDLDRYLFRDASIEIDSRNHILYIGESYYLRAIRTTDYQLVSGFSFGDIDGFKALYNEPDIIVDEEDVFYGNYRFDGQDLGVVHGSYKGSVKHVIGNYIVTDKGVYDRNTYSEIVSLDGDILIDRSGYVYYYSEDNKIEKEKWDLFLDLDGYYEQENGLISFYHDMTDLVFDHANGQIYAISKDQNKLYYIDSENLTVEHEMMIGSDPTDIELYNGNIYVSLSGATKVAVTSALYNGKVEYITLHTNPNRIAVGKNKLFFTSGYTWEWLSAFDFSNKSVEKQILRLSDPELLLDEARQMLYIGETGSSGSNLYAISAADSSQKYKSNFNNGYGFPYPRSLIRSGDELFYGQSIIDADDVNVVKGDFNLLEGGPGTYQEGESVDDEYVIAAIDSHVFSDRYIYERTTKKMVSELPFRVAFIDSDAAGAYYIYGAKNRTLVKYDSYEELAADWPLFDEDYEIQVPEQMSNYVPDDLEDHWASEPLIDFLTADLLTGYKNDDGSISLKPDHQITRAEFVTILVRALGLEGDQGSKSFRDVKPFSWYFSYVRVANAHGIVQGLSKTDFAPNRPVRRDEMAAMIVRAFESSIDFNGESKVFRDVPSYWATDSINKASSVGIIKGVSESLFNPKANAKRSEAVVMLYRALHMESNELPSDDEIKNIALLFEREMLQVYGKDITMEKEIVEKYTTGYYNVRNNWNADFRKELMDHGVDMNVILQNELSAVVIDKSNRFAAVELKGAIYKTEYKKGQLTRTTSQDTSGILYMRKMPADGSWKIYNVKLPTIYL